MTKRYRGFTLTLNNYNDEEYSNILHIAQLHTQKYIFGKEVGKQGTPHIQGYLYFKDAKTLKGVISLYNNKRIHFEGAKGTPRQNYNYCSKDGIFETNMVEYKEKEGGTLHNTSMFIPITQIRINKHKLPQKEVWEINEDGEPEWHLENREIELESGE